MRYGAIRPRCVPFCKIVDCFSRGSGFSPSLNLVPASLAQSWQRLRFRRFRKFDWRKSRRPEQRIHQRAILGAQTGDVCFKQAYIFDLN